jgi:hypothetical protein
LGSSEIQFVDPIGDVVLAKGDRKGAESVGLNDVATDFEVASVNIGDDIRSSDDQEFVATFEIRSTKIVGSDSAGLNTRAHAAIKNDDTVVDCFKKGAHRGSPADGLGAERGSNVISPQAGASRPPHQVSFGSSKVAERHRNPIPDAGSFACGL